MDNLGDWLYILILVAAGISGLSSGKKKKQAQQPPRQQPSYGDINKPQETQEQKGFWEIFDEMQQEHKRQQPAQQPMPQQIKTEKPKKTQKKQTVVSTPAFKEGERAIMATAKSSLANSSDTEDFNLLEDSLLEVEELKKAVIYSEILNRKY
ncbi:hypothetical protein M2459_003389 [Parabacteroides sp. PF5-5]|uniref:hypothetical protein n=1 Tax=unclassified Parabacteroides TaxID=2649774 RepID=UPI0024731DA7|nr:MULTISPECIES: hypothetical protein [unclassified Parabacteroides]MDH6306618.1 hypothetical protein [Parabacteroides sp. PH5-39]MDH6317585.1 hypothetical protein [Parabacteroides sp. PF5-13]MDH6321329.1 hypothetical protein [Parabacteroides sp. PH5-13]MDH6325106.1 hypothetical protein [Parabacteroides sp. PH5-8]MDH6328815.1 hypothetical protein [Parabacteroides sp. PH5-41]